MNYVLRVIIICFILPTIFISLIRNAKYIVEYISRFGKKYRIIERSKGTFIGQKRSIFDYKDLYYYDFTDEYICYSKEEALRFIELDKQKKVYPKYEYFD